MNFFLPKFRTDEALIRSFNHILAMIIFAILSAAICLLYNIMHVFVYPMIWALLFGTVLFPIKERIKNRLFYFTMDLELNNQSLFMTIVKFPFVSLDNFSENIYTFLLSFNGLIALCSYILLKLLSLEGLFLKILALFGHAFGALNRCMDLCELPYILEAMVAYGVIYVSWIYCKCDLVLAHKKIARAFSSPLWLFILVKIAGVFGPLRSLALIAASTTLLLISLGHIGVEEESQVDTDTETLKKKCRSHKSEDSDETVKIDEDGKPIENTQSFNISQHSPKTSTSTTNSNSPPWYKNSDTIETLKSDALIRGIFSFYGLVFLSRHDWAVFVLLLPFCFILVKRSAKYLHIEEFFCGAAGTLWSNTNSNFKKLFEILFAGPLRHFLAVLFSSDQRILAYLAPMIHSFSSVLVMTLFTFLTIIAVLFTGFQLLNEFAHLASLLSNFVASHQDFLVTAMNYTGHHLEKNDIDIDGIVLNGYEASRNWLAKNIRSYAIQDDSQRAAELEAQVLKIIDVLYASWETRNAPTVPLEQGSHLGLFSQLGNISNFESLKTELFLFIQENIQTLIGIAQSLWSFMSSNVSLASNFCVALVVLVVDFGFDIINFVVGWFAFIIMLFYLLTYSSKKYLPLQWLTDLIDMWYPPRRMFAPPPEKEPFVSLLEKSIAGVFTLSIKMAVFYGLYNYCIYSIFNLGVTFIPSLLAAFFAVTPVVTPSAVTVIGLFELFFIHQNIFAGCVFAALGVAPMLIADSTFLSEVKYTHPYVTGLAIVGGLYAWGLQGAIFAPIVMSSFNTAVNFVFERIRDEQQQQPSFGSHF